MNKFPNFVHDFRGNRWVIIAPGRVSRPHDNLPAPPGSFDPSCPFERGNEALNEEVFRVGGGRGPGDPNWQIRVIKNKYPITDLHEVIIHSPDHDRDVDELPLSQVELILQTYRARYNYHHASEHDGQVLIFNNHDVHAGASISHPHSQLVVVPKEINLETIAREPVNNLVTESSYFSVYCPDFSQWPYEVWIAPLAPSDSRGAPYGNEIPPFRSGLKTFGQISDEEIKDLAVILQKLLRFIIKRFSERGAEAPYNYYIYHGPGWYLRIIPRLIHRAGLELGTGLSVNIIDPAKAAEQYRLGLQ